jgi:drug/metabolite transporter (DMT)-like permease
MNDFYVGTVSLLISNVLLSSYPILIKTYISDISVIVQLIIRISVYICLSLPFLIIGGEGMNILSALIDPKYLAISAVNLLHIYSSYKGFQYLNAGISLTTFYSYPIIQVLLARIFLGTELTKEIMFSLFGSLIGIGILNKDTIFHEGTLGINVKRGFSFIAIAAITEAIIGVFYKGVNIQNPFMSLYTLYAPAFVFFIVWYIFYYKRNEQIIENSKENLDKQNNWWYILTNHGGIMTKIILFNLLIGGIGYTLRLLSLTKIPISWFSELSFTSSLSAFVLGWYFLGEKISLNHLVGSAIIFYNIYRIKQLL